MRYSKDTSSPPTVKKSLLEKQAKLDKLKVELGIVNLSMMPSPNGGNDSEQLLDHTISMLTNFQRFKNGDTTAPVKEIFIDKMS